MCLWPSLFLSTIPCRPNVVQFPTPYFPCFPMFVTCVDQGFDISFLVTHTHLEKLWKHKLIDFIIQFMEDIDKEISGMKIAINARGRIIAQQFMLQFVQ